jgi:hypothetical protein
VSGGDGYFKNINIDLSSFKHEKKQRMMAMCDNGTSMSAKELQ